MLYQTTGWSQILPLSCNGFQALLCTNSDVVGPMSCAIHCMLGLLSQIRLAVALDSMSCAPAGELGLAV